MKFKIPELLLVLYLFLPMGRGSSAVLIGQVLLCQISAIHATKNAIQQLNLDSENAIDQAFHWFLLALWYDPSNVTVRMYLTWLSPSV